MSSRSAARFLAVQTLYQLDLVPGDAAEAFPQVAAMHEAPPEVASFGLGLVEGTLARVDEIDPLIAEFLSEHWTLARVGRVEKAIMRLASFELVRDREVPTAVILNEALELTRDFLDDGAVKFVNGVLDQVARRARGEVPVDLAATATEATTEDLEPEGPAEATSSVESSEPGVEAKSEVAPDSAPQSRGRAPVGSASPWGNSAPAGNGQEDPGSAT